MDNTFSFNTLSELINIDEHINFAESILNKYSWDSKIKQKLSNQLSRIKSKKNDEHLNISIVGEFSSGKSTFINALIKEDLLVSSILQGTTVVNTVIEYNPSWCLRIKYYKKPQEFIIFKSLSELRERLSVVSTNPDTAKQIQLVRAGLPVDVLKSGIRIIDTPGTNSINDSHEATTKRALQELSDMSVVLTDATKILPKTLIDFMEDNIGNNLQRCVIAATHFDVIPKRERNDIITYIQKKISSIIPESKKKILTLPFAAPAIIGEIKGEKLVESQEEMAKLTQDSFNSVFEHVAASRKEILIRSLIALIADMYTNLGTSIKSIHDSYVNELNILQKSKQADLRLFIEEQKNNITNRFYALSKPVRETLINTCTDTKYKAKANISQKIRGIEASIVGPLKDYINNELENDCKKEIAPMASALANAQTTQDKSYIALVKVFQRSFTKQFEKLGLLKIQFNPDDLKVPATLTIGSNSMSRATEYVKNEEFNENFAFGGSAIGGMAIGALLGPVGAIIGGVVGFIAGGLFSPDINKVKSKLINELSTPLDTAFTSAADEVLSAFDERAIKMSQALGQELDSYLNKYKRAVDDRIEGLKMRKATTQKKIDGIKLDMQLIDTHNQQLKVASSKLS